MVHKLATRSLHPAIRAHAMIERVAHGAGVSLLDDVRRGRIAVTPAVREPLQTANSATTNKSMRTEAASEFG